MPTLPIRDFSKGVIVAIAGEDAPKDSLQDGVNIRVGQYGSVERRTGAVKEETSAVSAAELTSIGMFTFSDGNTVLLVSDGASIWFKVVCAGEAY